jgi:trehalose 6-phosphate phosphatase
MTLWIFDFDGTLSPIVSEPAAAAMHPACRNMLEDLVAVRQFRCAVLSSRAITDLERRVNVPGVFLGGGSGMEWRLPDGSMKRPEADQDKQLQVIRETVMPEIMQWNCLPGVVIEDKKWSLAIHTRRADNPTKKKVAALLDQWKPSHEIRMFRGPEVVEIQLLPGVDKALGVRAVCDLVEFKPRADYLVYAGDDDNDAEAMKLVRSWGGAAVAVGQKVLVAGAEMVPGPIELAQKIRRMANLDD